MNIDDLQKALDNRPSHKWMVNNLDKIEDINIWFEKFERKFAIFKAELNLPVGEWLTKNAKTLSDLFWENNIEWNEWLRMGVTEAKQIALAPKYQGKWGSVDEIQPRLMKLVQERDDNKLLVIQAVTKLRAKEEEFEEKSMEYAKLVAGQAKEYAEKMIVVQAKELSLRKQFQDLIDAIPFDMMKVGRKYEVYSVGTKKQWIEWLVRYNQILDAVPGLSEKLLVDRKQLEEEHEMFSSKVFGNLEMKAHYEGRLELINELLEPSGEPLNLALAFTDVRTKKKHSVGVEK